ERLLYGFDRGSTNVPTNFEQAYGTLSDCCSLGQLCLGPLQRPASHPALLAGHQCAPCGRQLLLNFAVQGVKLNAHDRPPAKIDSLGFSKLVRGARGLSRFEKPSRRSVK